MDDKRCASCFWWGGCDDDQQPVIACCDLPDMFFIGWGADGFKAPESLPRGIGVVYTDYGNESVVYTRADFGCRGWSDRSLLCPPEQRSLLPDSPA